jgi:hypothetical protein
LVAHADDDFASLAVGKRHKVAGKRFGVSDILLELGAAVFAARDQFDKLYCFHS